MTHLPAFDAIADDLAFLDDWEDRYKYLIELGGMLPAFPEAEKTDAHKVRGCVSQVWLRVSEQDAAGETRLTFAGDSDALIVKGLVAVVIALYSGRTLGEIVQTDAAKALGDLGLREHLTPQRANGLNAMVQTIRAEASKRLATL